jgi:hypothetical protein
MFTEITVEYHTYLLKGRLSLSWGSSYCALDKISTIFEIVSLIFSFLR